MSLISFPVERGGTVGKKIVDQTPTGITVNMSTLTCYGTTTDEHPRL